MVIRVMEMRVIGWHDSTITHAPCSPSKAPLLLKSTHACPNSTSTRHHCPLSISTYHSPSDSPPLLSSESAAEGRVSRKLGTWLG